MGRPREPLPTRVEDTPRLPPEYDAALDAGLGRPVADADSRPLAPPSRDTPGCSSPGRRPSTSPRSAIRRRVARGARDRQPERRPVLRERDADRYIDLGSGGGYPGLPIAAALPAARALLLEPVAKKAAFLSVAAMAHGPGASPSRPPRSGRRPSPRTAAIAAAGRPYGSRGREPRRPRRAGLPAARAGRDARRVEARRPGRGDRRPRNGRSTRSAEARSRSGRSTSRVSTAIAWCRRRPAAGSRPATRAIPPRASGGHGERRAARFERRANRGRLGHPQQPARPRRRSRQDRIGRRRLAPRGRRRLRTGAGRRRRSPDGV